MILPIYAFGQPVLKKVAEPITSEYPELPKLLENMFETMHHAEGVGLAAPQIGLPIRLFVIDTNEVERKEPFLNDEPVKLVFVNARLLETSGALRNYEEGCLSIPDIRGDVERPENITLTWEDENFETHTASFGGINSRVIQHEYDHLQGILFTEKLKPLKKRMVQGKLEKIRLGKVKADYKMKYFNIR